MHTLKIVGLGPGSMEYLTMAVHKLLLSASKVLLRTERHPVVSELAQQGMCYESYDYLYETAETFDETYMNIAKDVINRLKTEDVVYAVPGNPFVAESTVALLMEASKEGAFKTEIFHGASFLDALITTLKYDPVNGLVVKDALKVNPLDISDKTDHIWIQVYNQQVASQLKIHLMECFDDDHSVVVIQAAGVPELEKVVTVPLYEMDRYPELFDHLTSVFVKKAEKTRYDWYDLLAIMAKLRSENGCPWDREQTHLSLTPFLVEEAYEVKEAVELEDDESLADELGDVLLQVVFHAQIGEEEGYFNWRDVVTSICEKMVRRHPHVFGSVAVENSDEVLVNWQAIKDEEKSHETISESMKSVSKGIPALMRSHKVQKRAANVGFDWSDVQATLEKVREEVEEVETALASQSVEALYEELGDLLLIVTNVVRKAKGDSETILNEAIDKFINRFEYVENCMNEQGIPLSKEQIDIMENFWQQAKLKKR